MAVRIAAYGVPAVPPGNELVATVGPLIWAGSWQRHIKKRHIKKTRGKSKCHFDFILATLVTSKTLLFRETPRRTVS